jgi:hypothetical protein
MSNVIDFLESMGQDAALRHVTGQNLRQAMNDAKIDPALQAAIIAGDQAKIETLLGAKTNICAMIFPVESDEGNDRSNEVGMKSENAILAGRKAI